MGLYICTKYFVINPSDDQYETNRIRAKCFIGTLERWTFHGKACE